MYIEWGIDGGFGRGRSADLLDIVRCHGTKCSSFDLTNILTDEIVLSEWQNRAQNGTKDTWKSFSLFMRHTQM